MPMLLKNPWTWLLIAFVVLTSVVGFFLFGKNSMSSKKEFVGDDAVVSKSEKLSNDEKQALVERLESGNDIPQETDEDGEAGSGNQSTREGDRIDSAKSIDLSQAGDNKNAGTAEENLVSSEKTEKLRDNADAREESFSVLDKLVSWGFSKKSERKIDTIVLHSTYNALGGDPFSVSKIIDIYKSYGVSPHYLLARDGTVYRLVKETNIAYHAGESQMKDGRDNVNDFSIGIEIIGKADGNPTDEQYVSLQELIADIKSRYDIKHILGHSDIASGRKTDPWGFDWGEIHGKKL